MSDNLRVAKMLAPINALKELPLRLRPPGGREAGVTQPLALATVFSSV